MKLLVYIVHHGRLSLLQKCCRSVAAALPEKAQVFILLNGHGLPAEKWLTEFRHPAFRWLAVTREHRALARNRAFSLDSSDIIHFLDDDVTVPASLFREVITRFEKDPDLHVLGGPNLTPPESPFHEQLFGAVMTSFSAAPLVRGRYDGAAQDQLGAAASHSLILCNLAVRGAAIPADLRFRDRLRSNEENLLLYACAERGLKLAFSRRLYVYHSRRPRLFSFLDQIFSYGWGRGQQARICGRSTPMIFWVPAIAWLLLGSLIATRQFVPLVALLTAYAVTSLLGAMSSATVRSLGIPGVCGVTLLTPLVHGSYGLGLWYGALGTVVREPEPQWGRSARGKGWFTVFGKIRQLTAISTAWLAIWACKRPE